MYFVMIYYTTFIDTLLLFPYYFIVFYTIFFDNGQFIGIFTFLIVQTMKSKIRHSCWRRRAGGFGGDTTVRDRTSSEYRGRCTAQLPRSVTVTPPPSRRHRSRFTATAVFRWPSRVTVVRRCRRRRRHRSARFFTSFIISVRVLIDVYVCAWCVIFSSLKTVW